MFLKLTLVSGKPVYVNPLWISSVQHHYQQDGITVLSIAHGPDDGILQVKEGPEIIAEMMEKKMGQ